jgi:hypothetical protein
MCGLHTVGAARFSHVGETSQLKMISDIVSKTLGTKPNLTQLVTKNTV